MTKTQKKRFYLGTFFGALGIVVLALFDVNYRTYYVVVFVPSMICITGGFGNALMAVFDPQEKRSKNKRA